MLGIAGRGNAQANAIETAKLLNYYPPKGLYMMSTSVQEGSPLFSMRARGEFVEATNRENLEEQIYLLEDLDLPDDTLFSSGHMVNLVNITARMSKKDYIIRELKNALNKIDSTLLDMTNQNIAR